MRLFMLSFVLIASASACQKNDENKSESSSTPASGFYLSDTECDGHILNGSYISGETFSYAFLYVKPEACGAASISDADVIAYGLEPVGTIVQFVEELKNFGYSVSFSANSFTMSDGKETIASKRLLGAQDPGKAVTINVTNLSIEDLNDQRKISVNVRVNGPELSYQPSVWCESQTEAGVTSRLAKVDFQGTSPVFAMQAVVNDSSDDNRYAFPAKCQVSIGFSAQIEGENRLLDIVFGDKFSVN